MSASDKRRRRRHSGAFKTEAVAACRVAGASVAAVALERQVNANLLRRWVKEATRRTAVTVSVVAPQVPAPAFVPVAIAAPKPTRQAERPIRVQVRKRGVRIAIEWPVTAADCCAAWLRELLS